MIINLAVAALLTLNGPGATLGEPRTICQNFTRSGWAMMPGYSSWHTEATLYYRRCNSGSAKYPNVSYLDRVTARTTDSKPQVSWTFIIYRESWLGNRCGGSLTYPVISRQTSTYGSSGSWNPGASLNTAYCPVLQVKATRGGRVSYINLPAR